MWETERLILREFEDSDLNALHSFTSDPETVKYVPWGPNSIEKAAANIEMYRLRAAECPRTHYQLGVCLKDGGNLIGLGVIYCNPELSDAMIGWTLHKDHWRKGYSTELAAELIRIGFREIGLHRIYANCDTQNTGSYRVMEKNNMRREGIHKKSIYIRGEWRDEYHYAILEEEYV